MDLPILEGHPEIKKKPEDIIVFYFKLCSGMLQDLYYFSEQNDQSCVADCFAKGPTVPVDPAPEELGAPLSLAVLSWGYPALRLMIIALESVVWNVRTGIFNSYMFDYCEQARRLLWDLCLPARPLQNGVFT